MGIIGTVYLRYFSHTITDTPCIALGYHQWSEFSPSSLFFFFVRNMFFSYLLVRGTPGASFTARGAEGPLRLRVICYWCYWWWVNKDFGFLYLRLILPWLTTLLLWKVALCISWTSFTKMTALTSVKNLFWGRCVRLVHIEIPARDSPLLPSYQSLWYYWMMDIGILFHSHKVPRD